MKEEYSDLEQETMSITWYAIDDQGFIAEFDSGGVVLPSVVARNRETNELAINYFKSHEFECNYRATPYVKDPKYYSSERNFQINSKVLEQVVRDERSGAFIFEVVDTNQRSDPSYFCFGVPNPTINLLDLPESEQLAVRNIRYKGLFSDLKVVRNSDFKDD